MQIKRRWMRWVFEEVESAEFTMPWERGKRTGAWKQKCTPASFRQLIARA